MFPEVLSFLRSARRNIIVAGIAGCAIASPGSVLAQESPLAAPQPHDENASLSQSRSDGLKGAIVDSIRMLTLQHAWRASFEAKTRRELGGSFFLDYHRSARVPRQWSDGDSWLTNNLGHPVQGAASGFIWLNSRGEAEWDEARSSAYWKSRLAATAWAAAYSIQFEVGPLSEASIGNVGLNPRTVGWTDHVMTPLGGLAVMVAEDALDRLVLARLERRIRSPILKNVLRMLLNPSRATASLSGSRAPWHRWRGDLRPRRP